MKIFRFKNEFSEYVSEVKKSGKSLGFVPTMGSLHNGHLSLIRKAAEENEVVACSIFVNPAQFNNPEDLLNYPREFENDIAKLNVVPCDILFAPEEKEIYSDSIIEAYDMDGLDLLMEGKFRPGHFNGVVAVVRRLFEISGPCNAYFGEKDFQQFTIVRHMMKKLNVDVNIHSCPTIREPDGLAMSSRNALLTSEERKAAPLLFETLNFVKESCFNFSSEELKKFAEDKINAHSLFRVDYVEIASADNLSPAKGGEDPSGLRVFVAAFLGKVRLIDNIRLM